MIHLLFPEEIFVKPPNGRQRAIHRIGRQPLLLQRRQKGNQPFRIDAVDPLPGDKFRIPAQIAAVPFDGVAGGPLFDRQVIEIVIDQMMHGFF